MRSQSFNYLFTLIFLFPTFVLHSFANVKPYPAVEGLTGSRLFSVTVNEVQLWTEKYVSNLDLGNLTDWFNAPFVREHQEMHIASFAGEGVLN